MKRCTKCGIEKEEIEFQKNKTNPDGLQYWCKLCKNKTNKTYRINNAEKCSKYHKEYLEKNKEKIKIRSEQYRKNNPGKRKESQTKYALKNREKILERQREYKLLNKERLNAESRERKKRNKEKIAEESKIYNKKNRHKIRITKREYEYKKRHSDKAYKIETLCRTRIISAIKQQCGEKAYRTIDLTGCSIQKLITHLESKFLPGMTWENHGRHGWHIDHIIPCAAFDLTDPEQQKACFHYTNLQPLWAKDNLKKGAKLIA